MNVEISPDLAIMINNISHSCRQNKRKDREVLSKGKQSKVNKIKNEEKG